MAKKRTATRTKAPKKTATSRRKTSPTKKTTKKPPSGEIVSPDPLLDREVGPPRVTIFGAGITGLSAAHELVERGFEVHVIEKRKSGTEEYGCEVGGIARTQWSRAPWWELGPGGLQAAGGLTEEPKEEPNEESKGDRKQRGFPADEYRLRNRATYLFGKTSEPDILQSTPRISFPERFVFEELPESTKRKPPRSAWLDHKDAYGTPNSQKLASVTKRIEAAREQAAKDLAPRTENTFWERPALETEEALDDARLFLEIRITAYGRGGATEKDNRDRAWALAFRIREELRNRFSNKVVYIGAQGSGAEPSPGVDVPDYPDNISAWATCEVVEVLIPGEHGYRYFPAFYRHILDTMRRTPILDDFGRETSETAFDQLQPAPNVALAFASRPKGREAVDGYIREFPRRRALTSKELRQALDLTFQDMKVTERDLLHYEMELLRYATSCTRRRVEYESVSWWDFVRGRHSAAEPDIADSDPTDSRTQIYSQRMTRWLREIPQALAAMSSDETDARTHGNITLQLMRDDLGDGERTDLTLNGPTSVSWLQHWKRFLSQQGVRFYCGELVALDLVDGQLVPIIGDERSESSPLLPEPENPVGHRQALYIRPTRVARQPQEQLPDQRALVKNSDFFLLALPEWDAACLLHDADERARERSEKEEGNKKRLDADLQKLIRFHLRTGISVAPCGEVGARLHPTPPREPDTGRPAFIEQYPYRDLAGIQFFFPGNIRVGRGHVYYADSDWGLSSISQIAYWRDRPIAGSPFLGQISVDIGDWYAGTKGDRGRTQPASLCSPDDIARLTWKQILETFTPKNRRYFPAPALYHLDEGMEWSDEETCIENTTPFLLNLPGQWGLRPGLHPRGRHRLGDDVRDWRELYPRRHRRHQGPALEADESFHDPRPEIEYSVAHERWVLAGVFAGTYTRLNTMEAANESARHAVNSILDRLMRTEKEPGDQNPPTYRGQGKLFGTPCEIWSPEDHEWDDLESLKRLDADLEREGLPHFMDILRVPEVLSRVPHRNPQAGKPIYGLMRLVDIARSNALRDMAPAVEGLEGMGEDLVQQLTSLARSLGQKLTNQD